MQRHAFVQLEGMTNFYGRGCLVERVVSSSLLDGDRWETKMTTMYILVIVSICALNIRGGLSLCEDPRCSFTCRAERRGNGQDMNACLELCMNHTCIHELEQEGPRGNTSDADNTESIERSVKRFFGHPSRWIPTVIGVLVGVGVLCVVVYYTRKSYLKRGKFSRYGFSRLSRRGKAPKLDSEITELSEVRR